MVAANDRVYEDYNLDLDLRLNSRKLLRDEIVKTFLSEQPGYWRDNKKYVTRYKYFVEKLKDGRRIYLSRPTFLNKGIDFQVWVEKYDGAKDKKPSHKDIIKDLKTKKQENPKDFLVLIEAIIRIWKCEEPDNILKEIKIHFEEGFDLELLLKILKWLFIEQDVTYWNYDGRTMLKMHIEKELK